MPVALLALTLAMTSSPMPLPPAPPEPPVLVDVARIWDAGSHNAFTDLIRWRGRWYCTFREGDDHVGGDGRLRVLSSADGQTWTSAAVIAEPGVDLRDPKLSITPDDALMIVAGGSIYEGTTLLGRQPRVAFSTDGSTWSAPARVLDEGEWLWRVTWHEGTAYGVSYRPTASADWTLTLVSSRDGRTFAPVPTASGVAAGAPGRLAVAGRPNETTLRVLPDGEMLALVRRDGGNRRAWLGRSLRPYVEWTWTELPLAVGGPNLLRTPDGALWVAGRRATAEGPTTVLSTLTLDGTLTPVLTLPSGGDTSYPGLVWHDGLLWLSYYSSHEGRTAIYLARIRLPAHR